jgi:hypothetical protein
MPTITTISGDSGEVTTEQTLKEVASSETSNPQKLVVIQTTTRNDDEHVAASKHPAPTEEASSVPVTPTSPESNFHNDSKYAGDVIEEIPLLNGAGKYKTLPFQLSAQIASSFYEAIREQIPDSSGQPTSLHPWQLEISREICNPEVKPTSKHPLKYALVASNGSGKDQFVIAPFAIWFIISKIRSQSYHHVIIWYTTYYSDRELCQRLANKINEAAGEEVFRVRQRYIFCRWTGSEIRMFATDEEGKAEGYHPLDPNAEMCLIVNEAKSVTEEIHKALGRCSGYNYWLEVSVTG